MESKGTTAHAQPTERARPWSARFEAVIGPERPYVPRVWLMEDIAKVAAAAGAPPRARVVAAVNVCGERDDARAPGWPFVDRRIALVLFADRAAAGPAAPPITNAHRVGGLNWRRVAWTDDEAASWAHAIGTDAHAVMSGSDYDEDMWSAAMAAYMVALRDHVKQKRPRPVRPANLGSAPHGRTVVVGWLGCGALADSAEGLALHLDAWKPPSSAPSRAHTHQLVTVGQKT